MLTRIGAKWRWYDWIFIALVVLVIVGAIRIIAPTSGLTTSLHTGFHALAIGVNWLGNGLIALASVLNQI